MKLLVWRAICNFLFFLFFLFIIIIFFLFKIFFASNLPLCIIHARISNNLNKEFIMMTKFTIHVQHSRQIIVFSFRATEICQIRFLEREMFYLTTHSTHFIYGYMASDIWLRTILIVRKETRCRHIGYSCRLTARVFLYAPSHRQDNTYHCLCYTSRGALANTVPMQCQLILDEVYIIILLIF